MRPAAFLSLLLMAIACHALNTKLLTPAERRSSPPLTLISTFNDPSLPIRTPHFVLTNRHLTGKDNHGHPWHLQLPPPSHAAYRSGANYYFRGYTGGAGFAPSTWILALTFDEIGRPVPFYFYTQGTLADLVNLDGHRPQLLQQDYWGSYWEDPGLYVTTLYEQRGPYWYRSDGPHGAHVFPAFESWSVQSPHRPATLVHNPATKYTVRDLTNDPARGIPIPSLQHPPPSTGCRTIQPLISVVDTPNGRQITMEPPAPQTHLLVTGLHRWPNSQECTAAILWSSQVQKIEPLAKLNLGKAA